MSDLQQNSLREPRKKLGMGTYYDIVAGALYVFLAYFLSKNPVEMLGESGTRWVMILFGLYGLFRIGRGVYRIVKR